MKLEPITELSMGTEAINTRTNQIKRVIYALRCPLTNGIRYVGLTRNPTARKRYHRSRKKNPYALVDKWTADCAAADRPVKWQTIAVVNSEFASLAVAAEEAIIAKLKANGCDLLNADLAELRSRKRPLEFGQRIVGFLVETDDTPSDELESQPTYLPSRVGS